MEKEFHMRLNAEDAQLFESLRWTEHGWKVPYVVLFRKMIRQEAKNRGFIDE